MRALLSATCAVVLATLGFAGVGCGISERNDFLVGRRCDPFNPQSCDEDQKCLPHDEDFDEFRCRDRASFELINGEDEPPLAYCDNEQFVCPGDLVCNADRIRVGTTRRPLVCKRPTDVFQPPLPDASN